MDSEHPSDAAFEAWAEDIDQLRTHVAQAAFRAGWIAAEQARVDAIFPRDHICGPRTSPGLKTSRENARQPAAAAEED